MAQDFNNIPAGLKITTQIPLNIKENIINEATLAYLGIADNLAFTYHDQLVVTCLEEGTRYIWREVQVGEENSGLVPLDFTYPANIIVYGIDYSNKTFNFFLLPSLEKIYSIENIGSGENIYKNSTVVNNNTQFNLKKVNSNTLTITTSVDGNSLNIEQSDSGIPMFIVNSDYTGIEELGTISKPFKNLQNALDAYKGIGTNITPQFSGVTITIQKDTNIFTGSLAYANLNIVIENGGAINSNPSVGQYLLDVDSDATLPVGFTPFSNTFSGTFRIEIKPGGGIILQKQGFKNRGTNLNTNNSIGKIIRLLGTSFITIANDVSVASPSTRTIISINEDNQAGFFNDGNVAHFDIQCNLTSINTSIYKVGLNGILYLTDSIMQFGDSLNSFNVLTKPYTLDGGRIIAKNAQWLNLNTISLVTNNLHTFSNTAYFDATDCILGGNCNYLFTNVGATNSTIQLNNCKHPNSIYSGIISSPSIYWTNLRFFNCFFNNGVFNYLEGKLFANAENNIGGQIVETLTEYSSKAAAVIAGLFKGCSFIKTIVKTSGTFIIGEEYKITTIGTTDFTLIGASANTIGLYFTASGIGTGTGTATNYVRDTVI